MTLDRYLLGSMAVPVDTAITMMTRSAVDLRTIEEIDQDEADELRMRDNAERYIGSLEF